MVEDREDDEDDHENQRTDCTDRVAAPDDEETCQADLGDVDADEQVLKSLGVDLALGVDLCVVDVQKIVAVGEVEEIKTDGGEKEDERSNAGVADGCALVSMAFTILGHGRG